MSPTLSRRSFLVLSRLRAALAAVLLSSAPPARAALAPSEYQAMMTAAPEVLALTVDAVKTTPGKDGVQVEAQATVNGVTRSATGLKAGDKIALSYAHVTAPPGTETPPLVAQGRNYLAFLSGGPAPQPYRPAARGKSFADTSAPASAAAARPVWPIPTQPAPPGWTSVNLAEVKAYLVARDGGNYFAQPPGADAAARIPLIGGETPPLLLRLLRAAPGDSAAPPQILIYRAGTLTAGPPINGPITIDRAVIFYPGAPQPLGDALWSVTGAPGARALPQPVWIWEADKLVIENPFERTRQEVVLPKR